MRKLLASLFLAAAAIGSAIGCWNTNSWWPEGYDATDPRHVDWATRAVTPAVPQVSVPGHFTQGTYIGVNQDGEETGSVSVNSVRVISPGASVWCFLPEEDGEVTKLALWHAEGQPNPSAAMTWTYKLIRAVNAPPRGKWLPFFPQPSLSQGAYIVTVSYADDRNVNLCLVVNFNQGS